MMTAKHLLWLFVLGLLLWGGDRLVGWGLGHLADNSQFRYARLYNGRAQADVLLLGNSRGLAFYQPYIEQQSGRKTFNLSYNGLPMDAARAMVQDYYGRYTPPHTLVIDITICDRENDALLAGFFTYRRHSPHLDALLRHKLPQFWQGSQFSSLFRYNNEIFHRALTHLQKSDDTWLLDRGIAPQLAAKVSTEHYPLQVHPYLIQQLQQTVHGAQAHGTKVQLVIGPYFPGFTVDNLDALKAAAEQATGLAVHDYRNALQDPSDFGDFMHPNLKGSRSYIDLLRRDSILP